PPRAPMCLRSGCAQEVSMFDRRPFLFVCLTAATGCATTAGSASQERLTSDYQRSAPAPTKETATATRPVEPRPETDGGSTLHRASFVRAVLQKNPSIEAARQGWRAAIARVRESGGFEDPMVDVGLAPLSIGASNVRVGYEVGISQKLPWFGK